LMVRMSRIVPFSSVISAWCSSPTPFSRICRWGKTWGTVSRCSVCHAQR
jgi:hypothetical protein